LAARQSFLRAGLALAPGAVARRARPAQQPRLDDATVQRVRHFLVNGGGAQAKTPHKTGRTDPVLADALRLYRDDAPHQRRQLEADLLTSESPADVAARCPISPATVEIYHDGLLGVRARLGQNAWIWARVIRMAALQGLGQDYPGNVWKSFAYAGGALALELASAGTTDVPLPAWVQSAFGDVAAL